MLGRSSQEDLLPGGCARRDLRGVKGTDVVDALQDVIGKAGDPDVIDVVAGLRMMV